MKRMIALFAAVGMLAVLTACASTNVEPPSVPGGMEALPDGLMEELYASIVAPGEFWEDWWNLRGAFAYEHITEGPNDPVFAELQPTSGFASFDALRSHLLQYYTEAWLDENLHYYFMEEDGMLLVATARAGFARPDWSTARIVMAAPNFHTVEVLTVSVTYGSWHRDPDEQYPHEVSYRFTFVDGRIDTQERLP
ncbi:MAG: hypothetical protein FWD06_03445 [Oscillospiraceae bacterium]|nr:hypothetical protein [Oscillospiraceae bacterium]